jgi:Sulfotransferase family
MSILPFDQRACFIAGAAKSGTTLLVALLDNHPQLLVLPEETAYIPTALNKYGRRGRRAQFDYLTRHSRSNVLFGAPTKPGKRDYSDLPRAKFLGEFERTAFDPANGQRDLLAIMAESYAAVRGVDPDTVERWVEKTPANRTYVPLILSRFPHAKVLIVMRDPRAIFATQIELEKTRQTKTFSAYFSVHHWREAAQVALRAMRKEIPALVVPYEELVQGPADWMQKVCEFLEIRFEPDIVLNPTKAGQFWSGNSAVQAGFSQISTEPVDRWERQLSQDEIGWVEWHCHDLMPQFGYEPRLPHRALRHWMRPIVGETRGKYWHSRFYSWRQSWFGF